MTMQLPILQVIVPLLAAPLCLIIKRATLVWLFALLVNFTCLVCSILILQHVLATGTMHYAVGGWQAPIGIAYRIDLLSAYTLIIVSAVSCLVLFAAKTSITVEIDQRKHTLFYLLYLLCVAGLLGIIATGDAFNLFIFIEISALASYALIAMGRDRRALTAAFSYLLIGTLGATFILIGIGLMYMVTGTLNMHDIAERLSNISGSRTLFTAFAFFIVGVCLKLALFPLHWWLPNAYAFAPSIVSSLLAATATKVAIYVLLRFLFSVFGGDFSFAVIPLQNILLTLGITGILIASVMAIYQQNVKQLFAYSSVAQIGYMMLSLGLNNASGLVATLIHLFNHALMKGALFLALAAVMLRLGSVQLQQFSGLAKQMPWTMAAIVISGLSLIGIPLTVGFISKWHMIVASLEHGGWWLAFVILLGSFLAAIYVWRIVEVAYFNAPNSTTLQVKEAPLSLLIPIWILTLANLYFGIDSRFTVTMSSLITQSIIGQQL